MIGSRKGHEYRYRPALPRSNLQGSLLGVHLLGQSEVANLLAGLLSVFETGWMARDKTRLGICRNPGVRAVEEGGGEKARQGIKRPLDTRLLALQLTCILGTMPSLKLRWNFPRST